MSETTQRCISVAPNIFSAIFFENLRIIRTLWSKFKFNETHDSSRFLMLKLLILKLETFFFTKLLNRPRIILV